MLNPLKSLGERERETCTKLKKAPLREGPKCVPSKQVNVYFKVNHKVKGHIEWHHQASESKDDAFRII